MGDLTLPAWTARVDWSEAMTETLEWSTSVVASNSGAEQRRSLRISPRRTLETNALLFDEERARFDLAVMAGGAVRWNVPLFYDQNKLTAPGSVGDTVVFVPTTDTEFAIDGLVYFRGADAYTYEVRKITDMNANSLTLDQGLVGAWPRNTRVFPMKAMQFAEQPTSTKHADRAASFTVNWQVVDTNDFPEYEFTEFHLGYPVFRSRPDESGNLTMQYGRLLDVLDNQYSIPKQVDMMGFAVTAQQYTWFLQGRAEMAEFRRLLYALRGRVTPVWLPTFFNDMTLAEPIVAGDTSITIKKIGIASLFSTLPPGRRDIILDPRGGTAAIYRHITTVIDNGTTEIINVSEAFTSVIFQSDLKRISFMSLSRLSQDSVPITHNTDNTGLSSCTIIFQSTPENRSAADYTYNRFPNATMTSDPCICGSECGAYGDVRFGTTVPYDDSITYTSAVETTKAALYDYRIAFGDSTEAANEAVLDLQSILTYYDGQDVSVQRSTLDGQASAEIRAALDPLSDDDFPDAFQKWYAYAYYYSNIAGGSGTGTEHSWESAQIVADTINECDQQAETILATFCASILDQRVTKAVDTQEDPTDPTHTHDFPYPSPIAVGGKGILGFLNTYWASNTFAVTPYPTFYPAPGSSYTGWDVVLKSALQLTTSLEANLYSSLLGHLQAGCGSVPLQITDTHEPNSLSFTSGWPLSPTITYSWWMWLNYFECALLSKTQFPATVKVRKRNTNGQTVSQWVMRCYSAAVPGTDLFLNYIVNFTNMSLKYSTDADLQDCFCPDPDAGDFKYLGDTGDFIFDILVVVDGDPDPEEEKVTYIPPEGSGGDGGIGGGGH